MKYSKLVTADFLDTHAGGTMTVSQAERTQGHAKGYAMSLRAHCPGRGRRCMWIRGLQSINRFECLKVKVAQSCLTL